MVEWRIFGVFFPIGAGKKAGHRLDMGTGEEATCVVIELKGVDH